MDTTTTPLVSIVMPFYDAEKTLAAAIRSILWQTYDNWELILIDDGSSDKSPDISKSFKDSRILFHEDGKNLKLPKRLNQGIAMSRGKYVARMDSDDIAYPERIEAQVRFLEQHKDIDLLASRVLIFNSEGVVQGTYPYRITHADICRRPKAGFYMPHPTWMGKATWFRQNLYNPHIHKAQDQELLLRTYHNSRLACLPDILLGYRKNHLSLRTLLAGRTHYARMLLQKALINKDISFIFGAIEQFLKFMVETIAIISGLNYQILKHRALPVSEREKKRWRSIWDAALKHQNDLESH